MGQRALHMSRGVLWGVQSKFCKSKTLKRDLVQQNATVNADHYKVGFQH